MSTPAARNALRSPGRLSYGATSLTTAYPHGGTALGIVRAIEVRPNIQYRAITAEEYGGIAVDHVLASESWVLAAILRSLDNDALALLFPNSSVGGTSQHRLVTAPGTTRAGNLRAASGVKLVFTPDSPDGDHVVLYRAVPMLDPASVLTLAAGEPLEIGVVFHAVHDASGRMVAVGRAGDITL